MRNLPQENRLWIESDETAQRRIEQARRLKKQASTGGLGFEAYLTPDLAVWVLDMVERGIYLDPSEAIFVLMGQAKDIAPHDDIKREILSRRLEAAENGSSYTPEEVRQHLEETKKTRTDPAIWEKISQD